MSGVWRWWLLTRQTNWNVPKRPPSAPLGARFSGPEYPWPPRGGLITHNFTSRTLFSFSSRYHQNQLGLQASDLMPLIPRRKTLHRMKPQSRLRPTLHCRLIGIPGKLCIDYVPRAYNFWFGVPAKEVMDLFLCCFTDLIGLARTPFVSIKRLLIQPGTPCRPRA